MNSTNPESIMTGLWAKFPAEIVGSMREIIFIVVVLLLGGLASHLVGRVVQWLAVRLQAPKLTLRPLVVTGRFVVVLILISTFADHFFSVDFFALMGGLLALIAIGFFAVWSTLSNVLCALFLLTVRPFQVGDELELIPDPLRGRVVDLNLFFTTLRTEDGRLIQVPNNLFFQRVVVRRCGDSGVPLSERFAKTGDSAAPATGPGNPEPEKRA